MSNYLTYPVKNMNISQNYSSSYSHSPHVSGSPKDYPIDESCEDNGRSFFYCPCDEIKIVQIYGVGNNGTNTIWMESTEKVIMPSCTDYVTIMVTHPNDDDLGRLAVGQTFKRGAAMFKEGMDGNATGYHFHISVGTGKMSGEGWTKNSNAKWVLTTTGTSIKPELAFYIDTSFTNILSKGGLYFKNLPSYAVIGPTPEEPSEGTLPYYNVEVSEPINNLIAAYNGCSVWAKNHSYNTGDIVVYNYVVYICTASHTSSDAFDSTNWAERPDEGDSSFDSDEVIDQIEGLKNVFRAAIQKCDNEIQKLTKDDSSDQQNRGEIPKINDKLSVLKNHMDAISDQLDLKSFFGSYYEELCHYIFEGSYKDDYVIITDEMTNRDKFAQYKMLYKRSRETIDRISKPKHKFSVETESFIFNKAFTHLTEAFETGSIIHVNFSRGNDSFTDLFLTGLTVNYEDKTISMTFGEEYNKFDIKSLYENALGEIDKSANSIGYIKETLNALKAGHIKELSEATDLSKSLSLQYGISSESKDVILDATGLTIKRSLDNGIEGKVIIGKDGVLVDGNKNYFNAPLSGPTEFSDIRVSGAPVATLSNSNFIDSNTSLNAILTPGIYVHRIGTSLLDTPNAACMGGIFIVTDSAGSYYKQTSGGEYKYNLNDKTNISLIQEYRKYDNTGIFTRWVHSDANGTFTFGVWRLDE